ncbi:MAG: rhomboid family intramembrane serine protease [Opitutales bacterium]
MQQGPGNAPQGAPTTMVTKLLVITIAVFVLQQVLNVFFPSQGPRDNYFLTDWFALSGENFRDLKVWTVLSYGFLHSTLTFFHILGNMLGLYFIGRMLEPALGRQHFLLLYLGSTMVGGLVYLLFHFGDAQPVVGASAAVFGILSVFCLLHPERPITLLLFFVLPLTVKPKWVLRIGAALSVGGLLFYELPGTDGPGVAHSAHLGGIISGLLYYHFIFVRAGSLFTRPGAGQASMELPEWFKNRKRQAAAKKVSYTVNRSQSRDELQKEVDRILDKINASGFGSLNESEKQTLDQAKDILR